MKADVPVDRKRSLSMMMALGLMLASGARADACDRHERATRQLERMARDRRAAVDSDEPIR